MDARNTGTLIRALREERGLTQRQLADALGVTDKAVSNGARRRRPDIGLCPACPNAWELPWKRCDGRLAVDVERRNHETRRIPRLPRLRQRDRHHRRRRGVLLRQEAAPARRLASRRRRTPCTSGRSRATGTSPSTTDEQAAPPRLRRRRGLRPHGRRKTLPRAGRRSAPAPPRRREALRTGLARPRCGTNPRAASARDASPPRMPSARGRSPGRSPRPDSAGTRARTRTRR